MRGCPCKGCIDRDIGCHIVCVAYKRWKEECDMVRIKSRENSEINNTLKSLKMRI